MLGRLRNSRTRYCLESWHRVALHTFYTAWNGSSFLPGIFENHFSFSWKSYDSMSHGCTSGGHCLRPLWQTNGPRTGGSWISLGSHPTPCV